MEGLEPPTCGFGDRCSPKLSYTPPSRIEGSIPTADWPGQFAGVAARAPYAADGTGRGSERGACVIVTATARDRFVRCFDDAGPDYARAGGAFLSPSADLLIEAGEVAPGQQVLDLATGPGTVALPAARITGLAGAVTGVDLSATQLRLARTAAAGERLQAHFARMDVAALDLPDGHADVTLCGFGLPYVANPLHVVREAARVTRRGGIVAVSVWAGEFFPPAGDRLLGTLERWEAPQFHRPFGTDHRTLAEWMMRADLRDVVIEERSLPLTFPTFDAWWRMNEVFGFLLRLDLVDDETRREIRAAHRADTAAVQPDGSVAVDVRVYVARGRT